MRDVTTSAPATTLTDDELRALDAHWRAANYLTVGQIYLMANPWLEGMYAETYPDVNRNAAGMERLFRQFSFPAAYPATSPPRPAGRSTRAGELGYSLSHAYGAAGAPPRTDRTGAVRHPSFAPGPATRRARGEAVARATPGSLTGRSASCSALTAHRALAERGSPGRSPGVSGCHPVPGASGAGRPARG
ncbi:hypothetical protein [Streptomyces luteoverticillatus]|uniref:hypothetical protein n=1 Tax=Streptomyces luteoverticillatus TaxID=66425 RepID=UPI0026A3909C